MSSPGGFSPNRLSQIIQAWPAASGYCIAYSGGADSTALLHALSADAPSPLRAVHIHHGLHPEADDWATHCRRQCESLRLPYRCIEVQVHQQARHSPEDSARRARYEALEAQLEPGEVLLTAHHQDDQAETLLLQLLRGAGVAGLAAMKSWQSFGPGALGRPLLGWRRQDLVAWLQAQHIPWLEDPSNTDPSLRRNFLRHRIIPTLETVWPATVASLSRAAAHCREASDWIEAQAAVDLQTVITPEGSLDAVAVAGLPAPRARALLRHWFARLGAPVPSTVQLEEMRRQLDSAGQDRVPEVCWGDWVWRRWRGRLYAEPQVSAADNESETGWVWRGGVMTLPEPMGELRLVDHQDQPVELPGLRITRRRPGDRLRRHRDTPSKSLKNWFNEQHVPPWRRDWVPLVRQTGADGERLVAVADRWLAADFRCLLDERQATLQWRPGFPLPDSRGDAG